MNMAQDDEILFKVALGTGAVGIAMVGAALLLAVWRSRSQLVVWWVTGALQILVSVAAISGAAVITWQTFCGFTRRLEKLESEHAKVLAQLKRRTPAAIRNGCSRWTSHRSSPR